MPKRMHRVSQMETPSTTGVTQSNRPTAARFPAGGDPAKRDQILDGAHRVFSHMGFDAAGMADITRAAGVSKGTIYVYFDGKEELFEALMDRERDRMFRDIAASLDGPGTTLARLQNYGRTLTTLLCSDAVIQAHRIIIGISGRKPAMGAAMYEKGARRGVAILGKFVAEEVMAGTILPCDSDRAAQQFIDLCLSGLFRQRLLAYLPDPPSADQISDNVNAALRVFQAAYMARCAADLNPA
jgi:AcrR family transcriptional regulator